MHAIRHSEAEFAHTAPVVRGASTAPAEAGALAGALGMMGATLNYPRNSEIYGEDEPSEYVYLVRSGAVRTYKLLSDGRRQVGGFHLAGDVFGLEAGANHYFTAEAISNCQIVAVKRSAIDTLAARDPDVAREIWRLTAADLDRARSHLMLLGRKNALERVATFLLEMAARVEHGGAVDLPMSRQDIADYLGLTIETVSRTLTQLESSTAIELPSCRRHILLRNPGILRRLNA